MFEPASNRKLIGNVSLYRHLATRPPLFLRRNLRSVLDHHEKFLARLTDPNGAADALAGSEDMVANEKRRSGWDYPTKEMLEDLLQGQTPMLKIDRLQIRRSDVAVVKESLRRRDDKPDDQPNWLPDPDIDFKMPVTVAIIFRDSSYASSAVGKFHVEQRTATIQSKKPLEGQTRQFDVCLDSPFLIAVDNICITVDAGEKMGQHWKRSVPAGCELKVEISCQDSGASKRLLSILEGKSKSQLDQISSKESILRATWSKLPDCPPRGKLLDLSRTNGHRTVKSDYGVEISMGWSRKRETPLTQFSQTMRRTKESDQNQLLTPSSSDESERPSKSHRITYVFQETRQHIMESLECPLCVIEPLRTTYTYPTFDRLHLHLLTYHDHFRFRVENVNDVATDSPSTFRKVVHLELADKTFERASLSPDEEEAWVAPSTPFDQSAYLRGEDKWTGHARVKPQGRAVGKRGRPPNSTLMNGTAPAHSIKGTIRVRPPAREVRDLPLKRKKLHPVPTVPGIRFYRTLSKRPLREGELVAESDDEVDESWLQERMHDDLSSLNFTPAATEFIEDFNRHAGEEGFAADILTREGVVRFARIHRAKLRRPEWRREFKKCLREFRRQKIIDKDVARYCLDLEEPVRDRDTMSPSPAPAAAQLDARGDAKTYSTWVPIKQPSPEEMARNCICGHPVESARGSIICDHLQCTRVHFHLRCVGVEKRQEGWLCQDCKSKPNGTHG